MGHRIFEAVFTNKLFVVSLLFAAAMKSFFGTGNITNGKITNNL